jgi:HEAT repeat protein
MLAGFAIVAGPGCRVFVDGLGAWRGSVPDERTESSALALRSDSWKPNTSWSPLCLLPEVPIPDADVPLERWSHPKIAVALVAAENAGLISAEARRAAEISGGGPRPATGAPAVNAWFAALARRNDLSGWNAAILWSHYDPIAAREAVDVLARLVQHPPSYADAKPAADLDGPNSPGQSTANKADKQLKSAGDRSQKGLVVVSPSLQCAAAEAWCLVLGASTDDVETALAPAGVALNSGKLTSKVADELVIGIARWVRPDRILHLTQALDDTDRKSLPAVDARRAAGEACVLHAVQLRMAGVLASGGHPPASGAPRQSGGALSGAAATSSGDDPVALASDAGDDAPWPDGFWRFRNDTDPRLRKRLGELVAVINHPAALTILKAQMADVDSHVREAAFLNLGVLGTAAARSELAVQAKRAEERPRELAVRGTSCQGPAALAAFTSDKSLRVRAEAAKCVRRSPGAAAARVLRDLVNDASVDVQGACVRTIRDWPDDLATPLLLEVLAGSAFKARQAALTQLEDRRGGGLAFPLYAGTQERALRVQQWIREWNIPDDAVERVRELTQAGSPQLDQARLADIREKLNWPGTTEANEPGSNGPALPGPGSNEAIVQVAGRANDLLPTDLPLVEILLAEADLTQADMLLHHVLPRLSPAYTALVQLENVDVAIRRDAASKLSRIGQDASLSPGVCRRLHELLKTEQDSLVWRFAMLGVLRDGSDEAARLALLAINGQWPDVRALGCEYVGRHAQAEHAVWLLPVLYDSNKALQLAAITAAGKCGNPVVLDGLKADGDQAGFRGLRPLLVETQGQTQLAVVASMSRLGDPQAMQELVRLALDGSSTWRLEIVQTMGETGQTRFVEPLIRLAWTEQNHYVRQAALASLQKLVPPAERPQNLAQAKNVAEAVEIWASWWEDRKTKRPPV